MGKSEGKVRQLRIDKKHRFPLRIPEVVHFDASTTCFNNNLSINLFYSEAINFAMSHDSFYEFINRKYQRDLRRGYFTYVQDTNVIRRGKVVETWE